MFKVMTFNILVDKPDSLFPWTTRRAHLLATIQEENPDILCIQEALQHQRAYLEEQLPEYETFGVGRNDGAQGGEQTVIFHKTAQLQEIRHGVFWLSETPNIAGSIGWDAKRPRTASWKLLQDRDGARFYVMNTHFDHVGIQANSESAGAITRQIESWQEDCPVILCGDFNSPPDSAPYRALLAHGFTDVFTAAGGDYTYTYHMFHVDDYTDPDSREKRMATHHRVFRRIDHIFTLGAVTANDIHIADSHYAGQYPSDHFPVICYLGQGEKA